MVFLLLIVFSCIQGCTALIGAGVLVYKEGTLKTSYAASYNRTWNAAIHTMREMNLKVMDTKKDATKGIIEAETADGTKVNTTVKPSNPDITSVEIRVDTLGDEKASRAIEGKIRALLAGSSSGR